ncbi:dihydrolipoyl dehydrogenase family protein [Sporosarcina trichiuri]|uniref:dihydrolipoyl dehydrogenase family protein n=1 Tax=Sporosarcina trichiuri TaxID=3056445 RepID=UPI0025B34914|nr:NAD(P)/FAD-dependent oxidoreductase [Sporosarcina sp. 0.2-SM1T-5]WJY27250.1 NAD(P)/FAD-dependent oxidoreductase [Sporosarcina sp. 0.2-SM1T-5]
MKKTYDVIVVGTGTAGSSITQACRDEGKTVAVIDRRTFGGTCPQRGCDPKKVLVGAAEWMDWKERMAGRGLAGNAEIDWQELMAFKRTFTEPIPEATEKKFSSLGIDCYHGDAKFISDTKLKVGDNELIGRKIVLATGAAPMKLGLDGEDLMIHSEDFLDLDELPKKIIFAGGGYISMEFASLAARAGSEVHVIHRGERPLEPFDGDLVDLLMKRLEETGVRFHLNTSVKSVERSGDGFTVSAEKDDSAETFTADLVVHGLGRAPSLDVDTKAGNIKLGDKGGVKVNEYLQSVTNPNVYAAGDCAETGAPPLTPVSSDDAELVVQNLLHGNSRPADYAPIPSVAFTVPKVGSVGMTGEDAEKADRKLDVTFREITDWFTFRRTNEQAAGFKLITDPEKGTIVGAHLLGGNADELINHFSMFIHLETPIETIKNLEFAYPTAASDIGSMLAEIGNEKD